MPKTASHLKNEPNIQSIISNINCLNNLFAVCSNQYKNLNFGGLFIIKHCTFYTYKADRGSKASGSYYTALGSNISPGLLSCGPAVLWLLGALEDASTSRWGVNSKPCRVEIMRDSRCKGH